MYLFQDIEKASKDLNFKSSKEAIEWYRSQALKIDNVDIQEVMDTTQPFRIFQNIDTPAVGKMFMFLYDPKYKETLPFYDAFPLVFPISFSHGGFLGINLHYLPPVARAKLMNALYSIANNNKYNKSMKLMISYDVLKNSSNTFKGFENCVKRYLFGHVKSSFHYVNPIDWDKALLLPLQQWKINPNRKYAGSPPY